MLKKDDIAGVIFDFDDTLLDNGSTLDPTQGLHAISRLQAVYEAADTFKLPVLRRLTPAENVWAFKHAKVHTVQGGFWNILHMKGIVDTEEIDLSNELLQHIAQRKDELYGLIVIEKSFEIAGSTKFVKDLKDKGITDRLAVASQALRRDIDSHFEKYGLAAYFADSRIVSSINITKPKPDPQAFELAFQTLGLPDNNRRNVLAFEDDPKGVISAKRAGLYVCAITTRYKHDDAVLLAAEPDVIADSYLDFDRLIMAD